MVLTKTKLDVVKDIAQEIKLPLSGRYFSGMTIQQHCLDKSRVRDVIDEWLKSDVDIETHGVLMSIKETLNLDTTLFGMKIKVDATLKDGEVRLEVKKNVRFKQTK